MGLIFLAGVIAPDEPPSNLALLRALAADVAGQAVREVEAQELSLRRMPPVHEAEWLLEQELVRAAQLRGLRLYLPPDSCIGHRVNPGENTSTLAFAVLAAGVRYGGVTGGLLKAKRVTRTAFLEVHFRMVTQEGRVLWSRDLERRAEDSVPLRLLRQLEQQGMSFTQGQVPPQRGVRRVVEPALVVAVTGLVTYLFYAYRSR